jgi:hypothetical protein
MVCSSRSATVLTLLRKIQRIIYLALSGLLAVGAPLLHAATPQQLLFSGLLSGNHQGQFNAVKTDASGNIFLLLDEKDGVRVLKLDPSATTVLAQQHIGASGDIGLAMALDPSGNVCITGTTTSGQLNATGGAAFGSASGNSINSFVAKLDSNLNVSFITFAGGGQIAASAIAASGDAVFITGSIFAATLPVTPTAIQQTPAPGTSQNGFVEKFNSTGNTLLYATYLTGENGNTAPAAIAADSADNAYIAGYTSATGYPTINALVTEMLGTQSGFLTRLAPGGNSITFSTFISGSGVTAITLDAVQQNLYLSGGIAPGQFPVTAISAPLVSTIYQGLVKIPIDGRSVLSSTLLVPGVQSALSTDPNGNVWVDGLLGGVLLPAFLPNSQQPTLSDIGNSYALRVNMQTVQPVVDQVLRFGGLPTSNPAYASAPVNLTSIATDASGNAIFAGGFQATTDSNFLATQQYDLPLLNISTTALPTSVSGTALPAGSCTSGQCTGAAAYLAKASPTTAAVSFVFSIDTLPNLTLRNLGSVPANGVSISASGYTFTTNCGSTLNAGAECSVALSGAGPGSITAQAGNAPVYTESLPADTGNLTADAIVFSPKELDFGVNTSASTVATRTLTVSNLSTQSQSFNSALDQSSKIITAYSFSQVSSDCTLSGTTFLLAAGASCQIALGFAASANATDDGFVQAQWSIGTRNLLLTSYTQTAALNLSSSEINFGTEYAGGLHTSRYLYISNNSSSAITHTPVTVDAISPFSVTDNCPATLEAQTVCQIQINYSSSTAPSSDSTLLALDDGLSVLVTGETLPQPGVNGATPDPSLSVTPQNIVFSNPIPVTAVSTSTQQVTITNTGTSAFSLSLALSGDFTQANNCPASLAGGAACSVYIGFAPFAPGTRQGLLAVTAGSGSALYVSLTGTATAILPANNGLLDFGDVPVGVPSVQWFLVQQPLNPLTVSATAGYTVVLAHDYGFGHGQVPINVFQQSVTANCADCWLGIAFTPTAAGMEAGTLTLSTTSGGNPYVLALTGNGVALTGAVLTPLNQDFGPVTINSSSSPLSFTLTNGSAQTLGITSIAASTNFNIVSNPCGSALAAGASCQIVVAFIPTATGPLTGTLTVQTALGTQIAALTGYGLADPGLALSPDSLVFDNVPGTSSTQQTITLTNTGSSTLQIGTPSNTTATFTSSSACAMLSPGGSCTIQVTFTPSNAPATDVLTIPVTNLSAPVSTVIAYFVPLSGAYTLQDAGLAISPDTIDFGFAADITSGATRLFTVTNLTASPMTLTLDLPRQWSLSGAGCAGLAPNASCQFAVTFTPLTNGALTGSILATGTTASGSTYTSIGYLLGYGVGSSSLAISGDIADDAVSFGNVNSGQSASQTLTLTNQGTLSLNIRRITSEWPFLSTTTCGTALAAAGTCTITLTYTPLYQVSDDSTENGPRLDTGSLIIESDSFTSPDEFNLSGYAQAVTVTAPDNTAPLSAYALGTYSLSFAAVSTGNTDPAQSVTLSNTGTTVLHVFALTTTADFVLTNGCTVAIAPGGSCQIGVQFAPQTAGDKTSAVEISTDSSSSLDFLSLYSVAQGAALTFNPASLDFGTVSIGTSATLAAQMTNSGTTIVDISSITASGDYSVTSNCGVALAPGSSCTLTVTFTPTLAGTRTGYVNVANSATTNPLTLPLTGNATQSQLQLSPGSLSFGAIALGSSANQVLTLTNTGSATLSSFSFAISGDYAIISPCTSSTLAPGAGCSMTISFTPSALGLRAGSLIISSNDPSSPSIVTLSGTGVQGGTFTLTLAEGQSATETVKSGFQALYNFTLSPLNGFIGNVALTCLAVTTALYANCSLVPSSVALSGQPATVMAMVNTITEITTTSRLQNFWRTPELLCLFTPLLYFTAKRRRILKTRLYLFALFSLIGLAALSGCGSGNNPNIHFTPAGTYQFQVTGTSTTGVLSTQSVTVTLVVQ